MSGMIEVAQATVSIIPNMQGAQQTISSELSDICGGAGLKASGIAGPKFLAGFAEKLGGLSGVMSKILPAAAVAAVGKALFDIGSEFDEMTDTIIVGTGASGEALDSLKQSAMDIATTVPVGFGDAADTVQDLNTRLGLTGDTLTTVGTQIAQIGDMTGTAFNTEAFAGAMAAWGTAEEDMSAQLDTLFAVSQSTGLEINNLTGIVEQSAPSMQALGFSFEETASMAGLLDKAGLDAGGTLGKMSKALTTLAKDGEDPATAMQRISDEIEGYIEAGDKASAISLASDLFGTKGATQFVAAVEAGTMDIEEFSAAMANSQGIIGETQNRTMSFGDHVTVLKNQFKELLEPMGSAVFSGLSSAMGVITEQFGKFVDGPGKVIGETFGVIVEEGKKAIEMIGQAFSKTTGLTSFGDAMKKVKATARELFSAMKPVLNVLTTLLKAVIPPLAKFVGTYLGVAFKALSTVVKGVINVFKSFGKIIDGAKRAFEAFKRIVTAPFRFLSNIKIPRINISGGRAPWGLGNLGERPSISIKWAAKGLILDKATLIGAGEAGKEGIVPLSGEAMRPFAQAIAEELPGGGTENMTINLNYDASDDAADMLHDIVRGVKRYRMAGVI